jgi:hypothetical protein
MYCLEYKFDILFLPKNQSKKAETKLLGFHFLENRSVSNVSKTEVV